MPTRRRTFPALPQAGVGAVVVWRDRVLLVERGRAPFAGTWSVPGGLIELGETAAAAAAREVDEETGLQITAGEVVAVVDRIEHARDGRIRYHYLIVDFLARVTAAGARPPRLRAGSDARQARWIRWADLGRYELTPGLAVVLEKVPR